MSERISCEDRVTELTIRIKMKRMAWPSAFLPIWLAGWTLGGVFVIYMLISGKAGEAAWFLLIWIAFWAVAEAFAGYTWLWMAFGAEVLWTDRDRLTIRRELFGRGRVHTYGVRGVSRLRAAGQFGAAMSPFSHSWSAAWAQWGLTGGNVAFEHEGKTVRFGIWLEEDEAHEVVERLRPFLPESAVA
jgi:hypothetical protein